MSILKTTMTMLAGELERALRPVATLQVSLARVENNFRMVSIVEPEAEVLVCRFGLRLGDEEAGRMRCIGTPLRRTAARTNASASPTKGIDG